MMLDPISIHSFWKVALLEPFNSLFSVNPFIPHGHCYLWKPGLVGLHVISDSLIALAYYSIPITLISFVRKRRDLPFDWVFLLFGAFIVACGTTHVLEIWTLWHPVYWLSGLIKLLTAIVSMSTAVLIIPLVPKALALPSPALLEATNQELEREIAERRKSEARYRAIVEDQTEFIARFAPNGTLLFVNDAYCRSFGLDRESLIGKPYEPVVFEADRESVAQQINSVSFENPVVMIENRVYVGHEIRWTQWIHRALFDANQQLIEFQAVGRDITEQKQAEASLQESQRFIQKITDTTPVLLYVYDLIENRFVYANRGMLNLPGAPPKDLNCTGDELLQALLQINTSVQLEEWQQRWSAVNDGDVLQSEHYLQQPNGEWRYFQCQETLFACTPDGTPQQILGAAVDITDRKLTQQLKASLKEKEVLIKEINHRVKNNLQIIYSLLRLQTRQTQNPQITSILLETQNRVKSIALVHEKVYRSEDITEIDFAQYISSLAAHLFSTYKIDTNSISLKTDISSISLGIDQAIPCGLIVNELMSNALKYAFPAKLEGIIQIALYTNEQSQVCLIVKDNGIGFPESIDLAETSSLGLQLVQDFVEQLEGTIQLTRHPGTTFTITFPRN
ncbi:MAG: PAS domain S-box protein [Oscillatoriales cyanobacterium C42_A2020_001]|nr:PAS domain S-box protein [Leptolyngbyaceae cyanobacterium C42_A2020_001]